jgi:hypothetical protein
MLLLALLALIPDVVETAGAQPAAVKSPKAIEIVSNFAAVDREGERYSGDMIISSGGTR